MPLPSSLSLPDFVVTASPAERRIISAPLTLLLALVIYAMIVPIAFLDICTRLYQAVYFSALDIPKVDRRRYLSSDRWKLPRLNPFQRLHCLYCDYANGTVAWVKEVVNVTEAYSCAIRTPGRPHGREHQEAFRDAAEFH